MSRSIELFCSSNFEARTSLLEISQKDNRNRFLLYSVYVVFPLEAELIL